MLGFLYRDALAKLQNTGPLTVTCYIEWLGGPPVKKNECMRLDGLAARQSRGMSVCGSAARQSRRTSPWLVTYGLGTLSSHFTVRLITLFTTSFEEYSTRFLIKPKRLF